MKIYQFLTCISIASNFLPFFNCQLAGRLQNMNLDASKVTVSGFSAGGSMATQLYLAHSNLIKGVAVFSGLLYHCGEGPEAELMKLFQCSRGMTNLTMTTRKIRKLANANLLDPLDNLSTRKHFIEQGTFDQVVRPNSAKIMEAFFQQFSRNVRLVLLPHTHAAPTEKCGARCSTRVVPFTGFVNCGFSAAFEGLNYLYDGNMVHPSGQKMARCFLRDNEVEGLVEFDQTEFFPSGHPLVGMADKGFLFVPRRCRLNPSDCSLHVHFHGCLNTAMVQGNNYVKTSEFLAIAQANNLVVLFPQTTFVPNSWSGVFQCWDMIGITEFGTNYWGTKRGRQLGVIYSMMKRILGNIDNAKDNFKNNFLFSQ